VVQSKADISYPSLTWVIFRRLYSHKLKETMFRYFRSGILSIVILSSILFQYGILSQPGMVSRLSIKPSLSFTPEQNSVSPGQPEALQAVQTTTPEQPAVNFPIYMPLVQKPRPVTTFGSQVINLDNQTADYISNSNTGWVRYGTFDWSKIEPVLYSPHVYHWETVNDAALIRARDRRINVVATILMAPPWAQKYAGVACGPVSANELDNFAAFMKATVTRYSKGPYGIKYWELGNESDIAWNAITPNSGYGCWGDPADTYFGGGYYAEMLKVAYPAIKAADPEAKIVIGGLLLNCDPTNPPTGVDCTPGKFFEGILKNGGAPYFDLVNFHGYAFYWGQVYDQNYSYWKHRGGIVLGKIDFLRSMMAAYGVDKPIMLTEASLVCPEWNPYCKAPKQDFFEAQADYVPSVFIRSWAAGIVATFWFSMDDAGWRYSSLTSDNGLRLSYHAYSFMTQELQEARIGAQITSFAGLDGYRFITREKTIWVLWSNDTQAYNMTLPANVLQILDRQGGQISLPADNVLSVKSPVYIEIAP
jgi:hypothetical protein